MQKTLSSVAVPLDQTPVSCTNLLKMDITVQVVTDYVESSEWVMFTFLFLKIK